MIRTKPWLVIGSVVAATVYVDVASGSPAAPGTPESPLDDLQAGIDMAAGSDDKTAVIVSKGDCAADGEARATVRRREGRQWLRGAQELQRQAAEADGSAGVAAAVAAQQERRMCR